MYDLLNFGSNTLFSYFLRTGSPHCDKYAKIDRSWSAGAVQYPESPPTTASKNTGKVEREKLVFHLVLLGVPKVTLYSKILDKFWRIICIYLSCTRSLGCGWLSQHIQIMNSIRREVYVTAIFRVIQLTKKNR